MNWKGGKAHSGNGYAWIWKPAHPKASNGYVGEHILIAEVALGKHLPDGAVVHHHTPEQLVICQDQAYHMLLHQRQRALEACGHANWLKCPYCKKYDVLEKMYVRPNRLHGYHRSCHSTVEAKRQLLKRREKVGRENQIHNRAG
jgi:hypothetical protein